MRPPGSPYTRPSPSELLDAATASIQAALGLLSALMTHRDAHLGQLSTLPKNTDVPEVTRGHYLQM
jgi:hypothetical protein